MTLFENPFALLQQLPQLEHACSTYYQQLQQGEIDPSGPFIGRPSLTERDAFREIRESSLPENVKNAWIAWAYRLSDARVNARSYAVLAEAYVVTRHQVEWKDPLFVTLRELWHRMLVSQGIRGFYCNALAVNAGTLTQLTKQHWARRVELARRAGYESLDAIEAPIPNPEAFAEKLLEQTDEFYSQLVPSHLEGFLDTALAKSALAGWPAKLNPRTVQQLLGDSEWLNGLNLRIHRLPAALSQASFMRALARLGQSMANAATSTRQPFVVAFDPNGLRSRTLGALFGALPQSPEFMRRQLGLSRDVANAQSRAALITGLIHVRTAALATLLRARLCRSSHEASADYEALTHRTYGFALPQSLVGLWPRIYADSGQRLLGPCIASLWQEQLVGMYDVDWFRNPRGIESVRAELCDPPESRVSLEHAEEARTSYVTNLLSNLG